MENVIISLEKGDWGAAARKEYPLKTLIKGFLRFPKY